MAWYRLLIFSSSMKLIGGAYRSEVIPYATGLYFIDMDRLVDAAGWLGSALGEGVPALLGRAGGFPSDSGPRALE